MLSWILDQHYNLATGQINWRSVSEYDFYREVANMGYGDMLHDHERNSKYYAAIRKVIEQKRKERSEKKAQGAGNGNGNGKAGAVESKSDECDEIHVLDIGTGTGLLAMMAAESGADRITACEAFTPMADCAEGIFKANNYANRVHLIKKSSKDIDLQKDMGGRRANVLVAELLDTELIGEGALLTYNHAHENLLTDDVISIPYKAYCYAQVVQSPLAAQCNTLKHLTNLDGEIVLRAPANISACRGMADFQSVQLSELSPDLFVPLTDPIEIMQIDFNRKTARELNRALEIPVVAKRTGSTDLVFYWWAIQMDREGEIVLSCAPYWAHPDYMEQLRKRVIKPNQINWKNIMPWRDHWMQAIYYIPKPLQLTISDADNKFILYFNHDAYSLWFNVSRPFPVGTTLEQQKMIEENRNILTQRHTCSCYLHLAYSRSRIGQLNQSVRNKTYIKLLEKMPVNKDTNILIIGDGCLLGLMLSSFGAGKTWLFETGKFSKRFMLNVIEENQIKNVHIIDDFKYLSDDDLKSINYVIAEPYFLASILPWDNFHFGSFMEEIEMNLVNATIMPHGAKIYGMPVIFKDLQKLRAPVRQCEGFDMTLFNEMVEVFLICQVFLN